MRLNMSEVLKKRLVGLAVIVFLLLIVTLLIPSTPEIQPADSAPNQVTVAQVSQWQAPPAASSVPPAAGATRSSISSQTTPPPDDGARIEHPHPAPTAAANAKTAGMPLPSKPMSSSEPKPEPKSEPVAAKPVTPAAPSPLAKTAEPTSITANARPAWALQVGSFAEQPHADAIASELRGGGLRVTVSKIATSKGTLFRVQVGPYATPSAADADLPRVQKLGYPTARKVPL
jgi:cell division septation protein DedD